MSDQKNRSIVPVFSLMAIEDPVASKNAGRAIFNDVEMVTVHFAGDRTQRPCFVVDQSHKDRWPEEYAAFKKTGEHSVTGTPLEKWPLMTIAKVYELKALGIFSVDQLAAMEDNALGALGMNGRALREQARAWIKTGTDSALVTGQAKEIADLKARIERMEAAGMSEPKSGKKSKVA